MPEHITVYCRRPITVANWLQRWCNDPDYVTAAENAGFAEETARAAFHELRVTGGDVTYAGATRPIQATHHTDDEMVSEIRGEALEESELDDPRDLAELLAATREIVDFELGFEQAEGIGGVIAEQLALAVAIATDGIVDFYGNEWRIFEGGRQR